jgi:hypothetical protein
VQLKFLRMTIFTSVLATACTAPANSLIRIDLWGDPAPVSMADRTIVIMPDTKYINVIGGETIRFVVGNKEFAWDFDGITEGYRFDLKLVAPAGLLDHSIKAYVDPNPKYPNGR